MALPVFTPITAPILMSIDPMNVVYFLRERDRYELEVKLKAAEVPSLKVAPFNVSIDRALLKQLLFMKKIRHVAPRATMEKVTSEQIVVYLRSTVCIRNCVNPDSIEKALAQLRWLSQIDDSDGQVTQYCANFLERL